MNVRVGVLGGSLLMLMSLPSVLAAEYHYDPNRKGGPWNLAEACWAATGEGMYDQVWQDGNSAYFEFPKSQTVTLDGLENIVVTGLVNLGDRLTLRSQEKVRTLTFEDATIEDAGHRIRFSSALALKGNFTLNGGRMEFSAPGPGYYTGFGAVTIDSGEIYLGNNQTLDSFDVAVTSLQGTGGAIRVYDPKEGENAQTANRSSSLTVNQSTDTVFAGDIEGKATNSADISQFITVVKQGAGTLSLSGRLSGLVKVDEGRLYVNSPDATFGDGTQGANLGTTAILVDGEGILGGEGTIATLPGDDVVVTEGGKLAAGLEGKIGSTVYELGEGAALDLSDIPEGGLLFDLGSPAKAGKTYDQILVKSGELKMGTLDFAKFAFLPQDGFGPGTFTLFEGATISGKIGAAAGKIGAYSATLSVSGSKILLTVTP